jgi:hypothetical protein
MSSGFSVASNRKVSFQERIKSLPFPVPISLIEKFPFFELYPLDGGGNFITGETFGTLDDSLITKQILNENVLKDFGTLPELDFARYERWRTVEKSCWINRFYFIVPLSKQAALTKNTKLARLVFDTILGFIRRYPAPEGKEIGEHIRYVYDIRDNVYNKTPHAELQKDETDIRYCWFDFQPASRLLHWLYAIRLIADMGVITADEWDKLEKSVIQHADIILVGERDFIPLKKGNHQSLRATVLLYAAALFPETNFGREYLDQGVRVIDFHIQKDYLSDGVLHEISPSYHAFETWHIRDSILLAETCGRQLCAEAHPLLSSAVKFLRAIRQPDGRTPVVDDGYPSAVDPFLETIPSRFQDTTSLPPTRFYPDAGFAIWSSGKDYLMLDGTIFTGKSSHFHAGKNAPTIWKNGQPLLIDSGCCSYDDPLFETWYKRGESHSSLLIDGVGDGFNRSAYHWVEYPEIKCSGWEDRGASHYLQSTLTSNVPAWNGIEWKRSFSIEKSSGRITMEDRVTGASGKSLEFVFNFHPQARLELQSKGFCVARSGDNQTALSFQSDSPLELKIVQGKCYVDNRHQKNQQLRVLIKSASTELRIVSVLRTS